MTYADLSTGLPSLLLACEMPIFALLLTIAFSPAPFKNQGPPAAGPLTALVDALDVRDLLGAFVRGPMRLVKGQRREMLRVRSVKVEGGEGGEDVELRGAGGGYEEVRGALAV